MLFAMTTDLGFECSCCHQHHDELPLAYDTFAPAYWHDGLTGQPDSILGDEQCVIDREHFFVKARLILPTLDTDDDFEWGVWISLSKASFARVTELWDKPERVQEPPYFGWLATELPTYEPTTLNLKTNLHTQPVGVRPIVELEPTDHPLAVEQRTGITRARVQAIAELLLHPTR
jgi:hypothetical protein